MIKVTCIWSVLLLSLLYKASSIKNIQSTYASLEALAQTRRSRPLALVLLPSVQRTVNRHRLVRFVSGCKVTFDTSTSDRKLIITAATSKHNNNNSNNKASPQKTMDFLKRIGKVGNTVTDTECLIGVDEGNAGGCTSSTTTSTTTSTGRNIKPSEMQQVSSHFRSCVDTGTIDDLTYEFPYTSTGSRWGVFTYVLYFIETAISLSLIRFKGQKLLSLIFYILFHLFMKSDQVMGGISTGNISREVHHGRDANVLRGEVRLENNGGFIQMATNFVPVTAVDGTTSQSNSFRTATPIDASKFTGIELEVHCDVADTFNVQYVCFYI